MTLEQAFYKQKEELHAAQREIKKLNKELEASCKGVASEKTFQKQLSHIRGLNNKVSEYKNISERYKDLYEQEKAKVEELSDLKFSLELENLQLKERLKLFEDDTPSGQVAELDEANAQIKALKDEVMKSNMNSFNYIKIVDKRNEKMIAFLEQMKTNYYENIDGNIIML